MACLRGEKYLLSEDWKDFALTGKHWTRALLRFLDRPGEFVWGRGECEKEEERGSREDDDEIALLGCGSYKI